MNKIEGKYFLRNINLKPIFKLGNLSRDTIIVIQKFLGSNLEYKSFLTKIVYAIFYITFLSMRGKKFWIFDIVGTNAQKNCLSKLTTKLCESFELFVSVTNGGRLEN